MQKVKSNNATEIKAMPFMEPNKLFVTEHHDHVAYEYYLVGEIGHPEDYLELCHALRNCGPQDQFLIRINCVGGQVRSGNQIINAIKESPALTIGFIEHDCGSMATFVFLACDTWGVSPYAEWFGHTVSSGNWGKESETFEAAQFLRKQTHTRIQREYSSFLTEAEISKLLEGSDIYLNADEIMDRLEVFQEARESMPCDCGDPMCGVQEDQPSFEDMVKAAVAAGIAEHEKNKLAAEKKAARKKPKQDSVVLDAESVTITGDVQLQSK